MVSSKMCKTFALPRVLYDLDVVHTSTAEVSKIDNFQQRSTVRRLQTLTQSTELSVASGNNRELYGSRLFVFQCFMTRVQLFHSVGEERAGILLSFTRSFFFVSVPRSFLYLYCVYVILLWLSMGLPYNYFDTWK